MMRKLKLQVQTSVDGFIADKNQEMDWMTWDWDDALKKYVNEITRPVDCIILGRKLAQGFIPHWAAKPKGEDAWFVEKMNQTKKIVFSKTLKNVPWENTALAAGDLAEAVTKLKRQGGGDIIVYGGGSFVSALIQAGLIDEFHLFVNPVVLGSGMTIFAGLKQRQDFTLKKSNAFDCGIALLCYERKQKP